MTDLIQIHAKDNVAVALTSLPAQTTFIVSGETMITLTNIPSGHKVALKSIAPDEEIVKYGNSIGHATTSIARGDWVHTHNVKTNLKELMDYTYAPQTAMLPKRSPRYFQGYRRKNGAVGVRNEVWIVPTVGCVNSVAQHIALQAQTLVGEGIDGIYAFPHPYGCSQLGEDHCNTQKALAGLVNHPNAAAVLVLGLGCENNHVHAFQEALGQTDPERVQFLVCQDCEDEEKDAIEQLTQLCEYAKQFEREPVPVSELVIGLKCGGSDGLSGITANPLVGRFSDLLIAEGGSSILTEVPEMFGAETILMNRCKDRNTFKKLVALINDFKHYFIKNEQDIYENPSPGNKAGGITTLEDKSLGCIQKGGESLVQDVLQYGDQAKVHGLSLLQAPGNDLVASTALAVAGAQIIIFTTGRGTPFGSPVPTIKMSTNTPLAQKKSNWIDFDAGQLLADKNMEYWSEKFFEYLVQVASGQETATERHAIRDFAIFKTGVTL